MKILLIIHHSLDLNAGAPGATWQLGQAYQQMGHTVDYYSFDNLPTILPKRLQAALFPGFVAYHLARRSHHHAIDVIDASTGDTWIWSSWRRLQQKWKQINHPTVPHKDSLLVTRSHGLEHIAHLERLEEARRGRLQLSWKYPLYHGGFRLWEVAASLRTCDLALMLNHRDAEYAIHHCHVAQDRVQIVANGIPSSFLNLPFEPIATDDPVNLPTIRIAQVGSYIPRKGIEYGAAALNPLLLRHPNVTMSFLGTQCPEAQVYADFDPAVRDRIKVIPHYTHETLPKLLKGHHIHLFPSLSEGFSLALTETMACGLVPVTTATPGPMEVVKDGINGVLVPPRDSTAIVKAIKQLLSDRPLMEHLRRQAYTTAQQYSWQQIAAKTLKQYETACFHLQEI